MKIKAAVIGLGRIGSRYDQGRLEYPPRSHVGAILQSDSFQLSAVSDNDPVNGKHFLSDWNLAVPLFSSVAEMLSADNYDVVTIAVPTARHYAVLEEVIASRSKVVFCEKPFCSNAGEAQAIVRLSEVNGVQVAVNYHRRWDKKIRALKNEFDLLGKPSRVEITYMKGLYNYGSHIVDLLNYFFGPVNKVHSEPLTEKQHNLPDPSVSALISYNTGMKAYLTGIDDVDYELFDVDVYYPRLKYRIEMGGYKIRRFIAREDLFFPGYVNLEEEKPVFPDGPVHGLSRAYREIERYIHEEADKLITCTAGNALNVNKTLDAILLSAVSGKEINL